MKQCVDRTLFPSFQGRDPFSMDTRFYTAGSCFAEELYHRLLKYKFHTTSHPFGITFNPLSLARQFQLLSARDPYHPEALVHQDGLFHSLDHHGSCSGPDKAKVLEDIHCNMIYAREELARSHCLVLTLGSAHVYTYLPTNQVVANCHKIPSVQFNKKRVTVDESVIALQTVLEPLLAKHSSLRIVLSVSPVRYLRDGFEENNRSKATLLLCCDALCSWNPRIHYFPAYEIFMDDLRDYRYVADDMVHPTQRAIDYIWSYFKDAYFDERVRTYFQRMEAYLALKNHRVLHPQSETHLHFLQKLEATKSALISDFPEFGDAF